MLKKVIVTLEDVFTLIDKIGEPTRLSDIISALEKSGHLDFTSKSILVQTAKNEGLSLDSVINPYKPQSKDCINNKLDV